MRLKCLLIKPANINAFNWVIILLHRIKLILFLLTLRFIEVWDLMNVITIYYWSSFARFTRAG